MVQAPLSRRYAVIVVAGLLTVSQVAPHFGDGSSAHAAGIGKGRPAAHQASTRRGAWPHVVARTRRVRHGLMARTAATTQGNSGDIKISETTVPDHGNQGNEPHVQCQFYVLGFNFAASQGTISVASWPPTGDGSVVLTGTYKAPTPDSAGTYQFVKGPYTTLADGHYKVDVTDNKGAEIAKHKVFWIDPCATSPNPSPPTNTPAPPTDTPVPPTNTPVPPTDTPVPPTACPNTSCPSIVFTASQHAGRLLHSTHERPVAHKQGR